MSEMEKRHTVSGAIPAEKSHTISISERSDVNITGVLEVISFDETAVLLKTTVGELVLEGAGLRVHVLDVEGGRFSVTGEISGLYYSVKQDGERRGRRGIFR